MKHMSDKEFDKQFREKLGDLSSTPSDLNWIGIEGNLDAATHGKKRSLWWIPVIAAILMAGGAGYWMLDSADEQPSEVAEIGTIKARSLTPQTFTIKINAVEDRGGSAAFEEPTTTPGTSTGEQQAQTIQAGVNTPSQSHTFQNALSTPNLSSKSGSMDGQSSIGLSSYTLQSLSLGAIDRSSSEKLQDIPSDWERDLLHADRSIKTHKLTGFYVGPSALVAHTGTNSPALEQWAERNRYQAKFSTGGSFGLAMGYDFSAQWGMHGEIQFNTIQSQQFEKSPHATVQRSGGGENQIEDFKASYTRIPVFLKYRTLHLGGLTKRPSAMQYLLGFSYGRLNWVNLPGWVDQVQPDDFNMHEWGIVGGVEYVTHLQEHYSFTLGLRGGYYGHTDQSPFLIGQSPTDNYMFQFGLTARLQFHLPKADQ